MIVTVLDETDSVPDLEVWGDLVRSVLGAEGVAGPAETNLVFVDAETMAGLNAEHMGKSGPTDVLSFPIDGGAELEAGATMRFVGDIVVCPEVAQTNAPTHAGSFNDEVALLLVHATLHLLGHDHAEDDERAQMWAAEQRLLAALWTPFERDPWTELWTES